MNHIQITGRVVAIPTHLTHPRTGDQSICFLVKSYRRGTKDNLPYDHYQVYAKARLADYLFDHLNYGDRVFVAGELVPYFRRSDNGRVHYDLQIDAITVENFGANKGGEHCETVDM